MQGDIRRTFVAEYLGASMKTINKLDYLLQFCFYDNTKCTFVCGRFLLSSTTKLKPLVKLLVKYIAYLNLPEGNLTGHSYDFELLYLHIVIALPIVYNTKQLSNLFFPKIPISPMRCKS